ncbi:MAG TPA: agmatine deiminase family protein [Candidatus Binatia bacterium]|nr:agmatine deiminase family protein [Candidatus Binatia bacterium]
MSTVLPAEWAPQAAVLLTWPRADGDFARWFDRVEKNFIAIAQAIARFEPVWISCAQEPEALRRRLLAAGIAEARLRIFPVESDDVWARDHGPVTVLRDGRPVHLDFTFNGWGGKFSAERDNRVTRRLKELRALAAPVETLDFVLEGGGIESDGAGTLLTTERCLLAKTRNARYDRAGVEARLKEWLGVRRVLWLKHGDLLGDDTDGHIDTLARFCDARTIAWQDCEDAADPHHAGLKAMGAELAALRTADGEPYRLVPLPLPRAIHDETGRRLPAGYANFLIVNGAVLVPTYGDPDDALALERLEPCFPGRDIVAVDCRALIHQYGSLHCVTMQVPAEAMTQ